MRNIVSDLGFRRIELSAELGEEEVRVGTYRATKSRPDSSAITKLYSLRVKVCWLNGLGK